MTDERLDKVRARRQAVKARQKQEFEKSRPKASPLLEVGAIVQIKRFPMGQKRQGNFSKYFGPFRVTALSEGKSEVTAEYVKDPSYVLVRNAREVSLFPLKAGEKLEDALDDDEFEFDEVLDARGPASNREYLLSWKGFPAEFNRWIPRDDITSDPYGRLDEADAKWPPEELVQADDYSRPYRPQEPQRPKDEGAITEPLEVLGSRNTRRGKTLLVRYKATGKEEYVASERVLLPHSGERSRAQRKSEDSLEVPNDSAKE